MTKLIAVFAVLTALGLAVTATASWITNKSRPRAIASGRAAQPVTLADEDRAMRRAQLRGVAAAVFSVVMFVALLRVSIGLAGQAGLPIALTAGLSASGGLLLYSALPATRQAATRQAATKQAGAKQAAAAQPLVAKSVFILPVTALAAFIAFLVANGLSQPGHPGWPSYPTMNDGAPLILAALALSGSAFLVLHRLRTTVSFPDPRMAALDRRWRKVSARLLLCFTSGALLTFFGGTVFIAGQSMLTVATASAEAASQQTASPVGITCTVVGAALALAGVVHLVLALKGALTIRVTVREGASAPITA